MSESFDAQVSTDHPMTVTGAPGSSDRLHDVADKAHDVADAVRTRVAAGAQSARAKVRGAADLDVGELVQQHPWAAVAAAVVIGAFLGGGGGAAAAGATASAAAGAGRGAAGLASRATHAVGDTASGLAHRVADATPPQMKEALSTTRHEVVDTVADAVRQLKGTVNEVLHARIDQFVAELQKGIEELGPGAGGAQRGGLRG